MSAGILRALMQLFAIIARGGGNQEGTGRDVVAIFLRQQLNRELVKKYLELYDQYVEKHHRKSANKDGSKKRTSVNSVKVLKICSQINEELAQKEKIFVLIRLLEFINAIADAGDQEWEFVDTVSDSFYIDSETFENSKKLIALKADEYVDHKEFLYVNGSETIDCESAKHIYSEGLEGRLVFFRIAEEHMFFLRFFGNDSLFLNGQVLSDERSHVFNQGSSIRGSKIAPIYYSDVIRSFLEDRVESGISFRAENVSYYFKRNNTQALHQLNITEESGNLIGIMGGSGSGKSTLLNVLNGNYVPTYGKVTINGIDIHHQANMIEGVIGYVAQDDLLIEELTVFQNLYYNAQLCFDKKSDKEITELVHETLQSLGLFEAKDLKVGSPLDKTISGGQRKRLNIALELIREPSVLFVDEPTSGLSSRDSENIMDLLKELTLKGKLIFVVIHQPSSDIFKMFDKLFLLDQGGYPIYYGNPVESIIYFKKLVNHANLQESECVRCGNVNPEQIFNIIESKVVDEYGQLTDHRKTTPQEWNNFFNVMIGNQLDPDQPVDETPKSAFSIPDKLKQFKVFLQRDVLSKISNRQYMLINFLEAPLLALVLSFFIKYYTHGEAGSAAYIFRESENIPQYLFISVIVALFLGLTVSAEEIIRDKKILNREKFLNLSRGSYLLSKIGIMFTISAIQTLSFVAIGNLVLEIQGMTLSYWMVLFSTACFANLLGLNISASFNSAKVIYILIPILIIPQLLFSGIIVKFDKLHPFFSREDSVPVIGNVMASRWAYEALAVNQFKNNEFDSHFFSYNKKLKYYNWKKDFWVMELKNKTLEVERILEDGGDQDKLKYNLLVLRNELSKESQKVDDYSFEEIENLNVSKVTENTVSKLLTDLNLLFDYYVKNYNKISEKKEAKIAEMTSTDESREAFLLLKDTYSNESLEEFVTNKGEIEEIVEEKGKLVQKSNPVYLEPFNSGLLTAHFYAPSKILFGKKITTFSANMLVIWLMTLFFAIVLYLNGLHWFIERITLGFSSFTNLFRRKS
jgi:ABC-type multidrug transport system ATPase subunit